jgi:hypothetical protein
MATDAQTTVGALRQAVADFVDARDWHPLHGPKNLSVSRCRWSEKTPDRFDKQPVRCWCQWGHSCPPAAFWLSPSDYADLACNA